MKTIKILANLSPEKEAIEIAKQILKTPSLLGSNSHQVFIGESEVEIKELNSIIKIERLPIEPIMLVCSCCDCNFDKKDGRKIYQNYGGKVRDIFYCSDECVNYVLSFLPPDRASKKRKDLQIQGFF